MKASRRFNDDHTAPPPGTVRGLPKNHAALTEGRPLFPSRVHSARDLPRVLKSGTSNSKIGGRVVVGPWKDFPIYVLTLPERETCPRSCHVWSQCYGNTMPLAMRVRPDEAFLPALRKELIALQRKRAKGFVVRLHALGDFYSPTYARFWEQALHEFPKLHIFGYTARDPSGTIGLVLDMMNLCYPDRCAIRFSHAVGPFAQVRVMQSVTLDRWNGKTHQGGALVCPASTGKLPSCGECGACWHPSYRSTTIAFPLHGQVGMQKNKVRGGPLRAVRRRRVALDMIRAAVAAGGLAPTNLDICTELGLLRKSGEAALGRASEIVRYLEADGKISVERFQSGRIITLVATGQSTAAPANRRPHHMLKSTTGLLPADSAIETA